MIRLFCREASGQAELPATQVAQHSVPRRTYGITDHIVTLAGYPDEVLRYDMLRLLELPGGLYRPLTPSEQNALRRRDEAAATAEE